MTSKKNGPGINAKNIKAKRKGEKGQKWVRGHAGLGYVPKSPAELGYGKEVGKVRKVPENQSSEIFTSHRKVSEARNAEG